MNSFNYMNLVITLILLYIFSSSCNAQKLKPTRAQNHSGLLPVIRCHRHHHLPITCNGHHPSTNKKILPSTKPMSRAHFLAKALYGMNLCLQPKYGQVYYPFDPVHFPSLKSKPLLYYPMIIDRVINRKPIILPQTFVQLGKGLSYLRELRDYCKKKLHVENTTFALLPSKTEIVTCERRLLSYLRQFERSWVYRKVKALASIFVPICIIKMLHKRQTAREEAMCRNATEFIRQAQNAFYQTTRHHQHQHHRYHCHHHHHHH